METQQLFNIAIGLAAFFGGWVLNNITRAIERLDDNVRSLPEKYVTKDDYRRDIDDIKEMLGKIFDKLDNKVDK
jgi:copper chaperone CopZ